MNVAELLGQAGWAMYPIYLCSVVGFTVFVRKLVELRRLRLGHTPFLAPALDRVRAGDYRGAAARCEGAKHPAAQVVAAAAETIERRPDRAEAEAYRVGGLALQRVESHVSVLSFIATVAPLLGLLGTVLGMVDLFMGLQSSDLSQLDPGKLSEGIWKALLTTAAGLLVAVPTMAAHAYLTSRTDGLRLQMSDAIQRVLTEAPAKLHGARADEPAAREAAGEAA